jgi:outer membrane immunogenic protein
MRKILLGVVGLMALGAAAPASAADLPARVYTKAPAMVAVVYDWSGFYIGGNAGGGWSRDCWNNTDNIVFGVTSTFSEGCHDASGAVAGGQIGYRWQSANWVFGVEGQGDWSSLKGSNTSLLFNTGFPGTAFTSAVTNQTKVQGIGLLTGQVGYAWNNVLWYVKGGAAVVGEKNTGILTASGLVVDQVDRTRWGGTLGTGIEVGFAPNWSVGFEYDHIFLGNNTVNFVGVGPVVGIATRTDSISEGIDMATVRVNYRWGGPVVAKY